MPYLTFAQQVEKHIAVLRDNGFMIDTLEISKKWVRVLSHSQQGGRPELAYISQKIPMENGLVGIITNYRAPGGTKNPIKTYGLDEIGSGTQSVVTAPVQSNKPYSPTQAEFDAAKKAFGFLDHSNASGSSPYLEQKDVGAYGVRFRNQEEYGPTVVVPMRDIDGKLWSYQLLCHDGKKRFCKGGRLMGLFHLLGDPASCAFLGLAEGYATAATCFELTNIPTVCAFSADNLKPVANALVSKYPHHVFVIWSDNDRHKTENKGIDAALAVQKLIGETCVVIVPDFGDGVPSSDAKDFNDLVRIMGEDFVQEQIRNALSSAYNPISSR